MTIAGPFSDGINEPYAATLKRAWVKRYGAFDLRGNKYVLRALERIRKEETTLGMELRKLERHGFRLW